MSARPRERPLPDAESVTFTLVLAGIRISAAQTLDYRQVAPCSTKL